MLPPSPSLTYGETVTVLHQTADVDSRSAPNPSDIAPGTTYPAIATRSTSVQQRPETRVGPAGTVIIQSATEWKVMIFSATDPAIVKDDHLIVQSSHNARALGPSAPRGPGAWYVDALEMT